MTAYIPIVWTAVGLVVFLAAAAGLAWLLTRRDERSVASFGDPTGDQVTSFINAIHRSAALPFVARSPLLTLGPRHAAPEPDHTGLWQRQPTRTLTLVRPPLQGYVVGRRVAGRFVIATGAAT